MAKCLHTQYISAELRRDIDKNYWSIPRFWSAFFGCQDIVGICKKCGEDISHLCLTVKPMSIYYEGYNSSTRDWQSNWSKDGKN